MFWKTIFIGLICKNASNDNDSHLQLSMLNANETHLFFGWADFAGLARLSIQRYFY